MTRDKGYEGKKKKMKQKVICENQKILSVGCDEEGSYRNWGLHDDLHLEDMPSPVQGKKTRNCEENMTGNSVDQLELIKKMQSEIQDLKALLQARALQPLSLNTSSGMQSVTEATDKLSLQDIMK